MKDVIQGYVMKNQSMYYARKAKEVEDMIHLSELVDLEYAHGGGKLLVLELPHFETVAIPKDQVSSIEYIVEEQHEETN